MNLNYDIEAIAKNKQQYPDKYLIDAINGMYKDMPPVIAMAAGQKRKELMTAMQGAQAAQKLATPKLKDKIASELMPAEETGLAALPAQNMQGMGEERMLARGGIIAFANEGVVPSPEGDIDPESYENKSEKPGRKFDRELLEKIKSIPGSISSFFQEQNRPWSQVVAQTNPADVQAALSGKIPKGSLPAPAAAQPNLPPTINSTPTRAELAAGVSQTGGVNFDPTAGGNPAVAALRNKQQSGVGASPASTTGAQNQGIGALQPAPRVDRFAGLGESQEAFDTKIAEEKNFALGALAMNIGATIAQHVGPLGAATGKGVIAGLPGLEASRKTIRELEKGRKDYQFNIAKAEAALDEGDQELALKYKQLAEKTAYDMGMLAVHRTQAGAYAASVGSKADQAERYKREEILKGFEARLKQMPLYATATAEKRRQMEQEAMAGAIQGYNDANAALSGKGPINIGGISTDAIDAAIARKQKQS